MRYMPELGEDEIYFSEIMSQLNLSHTWVTMLIKKYNIKKIRYGVYDRVGAEKIINDFKENKDESFRRPSGRPLGTKRCKPYPRV